MAQRAKASKLQVGPQGKYPYPSQYGSHASMVVRENDDGTVVCKDEYGEYVTEKKRLDDGTADPKRYAISRLGKLFGGKAERT